MTVPNSITRTLELPHSQEKVWSALTTIDGLTGWFGSHATGTVEPGEEVVMRWEEYDNAQQALVIQVVEPMALFAYTWRINGAPEEDPRRTYVEFRLESAGGGTVLTVTESGFAQVPDAWLESSYNGNTQGWKAELAELVDYLAAA